MIKRRYILVWSVWGLLIAAALLSACGANDDSRKIAKIEDQIAKTQTTVERAGKDRESRVPWIKVNPNYTTINAQLALADPDSIFHYYRRLIQLRKDNPVMVYGAYDLILDDHPQIYAFTRTLEGDRLLVLLNFSAGTPVFELPADIAVVAQELLIGNYPVDSTEEVRRLSLRPYEARVYRLK